jgi:hypothetical protein
MEKINPEIKKQPAIKGYFNKEIGSLIIIGYPDNFAFIFIDFKKIDEATLNLLKQNNYQFLNLISYFLKSKIEEKKNEISEEEQKKIDDLLKLLEESDFQKLTLSELADKILSLKEVLDLDDNLENLNNYRKLFGINEN